MASVLNFSEDLIQETGLVFLVVFSILLFRYFSEILESLLLQGAAQLVRALLPLGKLLLISLVVFPGGQLVLSDMVLFELSVSVFCMLFAFILLIRALNNLPEQPIEPPNLRSLLLFMRHMTVVGWANSAISVGAVRLLIASTLGIAEVALFSFLQSLQQMVARYLPASLLRGLIRPVFVSRYAENRNSDVLQSGGNLLWKSNWLIIAACYILLFTSGDWLIALASGDRFLEGGLVASLLFLTLAFRANRVVLEMLAQITGNTKQLQSTALFSPVIFIAMWLVSGYGMEAIIVTLMLGLGAWIWRTLRVLSAANFIFHVDWSNGLKIIAISTLSIAISAAISLLSDVTIPVNATISLISLFLLVLYVKPINRTEFQLVEKAAGKRVARPLRMITNMGSV